MKVEQVGRGSLKQGQRMLVADCAGPESVDFMTNAVLREECQFAIANALDQLKKKKK